MFTCTVIIRSYITKSLVTSQVRVKLLVLLDWVDSYSSKSSCFDSKTPLSVSFQKVLNNEGQQRDHLLRISSGLE